MRGKQIVTSLRTHVTNRNAFIHTPSGKLTHTRKS